MSNQLLLNQALGIRIMSSLQPKISLCPKRIEFPKGSYTERPPSSCPEDPVSTPMAVVSSIFPGDVHALLRDRMSCFPYRPKGLRMFHAALPSLMKVGQGGGGRRAMGQSSDVCLTQLNFLPLPPPATAHLPLPAPKARLSGATIVGRNFLLGNTGCLWPAESTTTLVFFFGLWLQIKGRHLCLLPVYSSNNNYYDGTSCLYCAFLIRPLCLAS